MDNYKIEELKESFIYNASLGSKELFHSNIWAWIFEHTKRNDLLFNLFFGADKNGHLNLVINREKGHRDLTIYLDNNVYVIENKLKSIPDINQLKKYEKELTQPLIKGALTGIGEAPYWIDSEDVNNWRYVKYIDIANTIKEIAKEESNNKEYLIEYAKTIENLSYVIDSYYKSLNQHLSLYDGSKFCEALEYLRIWDLAQKYVASKFVEELRKNEVYKNTIENNGAIEKNKEKEGLHIDGPNVGFYNGKFNIDIRIYKGKGKRYKCIGIQIEGNQYRKYYQHNNLKNKADDNEKDYIFNIGVDNNWFSKITKRERVINYHGKNKETSLTKPYCSYSALTGEKDGYYAFVYQYWNINNDDSNFSEMIDCIIEDLIEALDLASKYNILDD